MLPAACAVGAMPPARASTEVRYAELLLHPGPGLSLWDVHPRVAMRITSSGPESPWRLRCTARSLRAGRKPEARWSHALGRRLGGCDRLLYLSAVAGRLKASYDDRNWPLTWVELRGFEPLTPSMRTRCATGLRHSPWNAVSVANTGSPCLPAIALAHTARAPRRSPGWRQSAQPAYLNGGPVGGRDRVPG